MSVRLRVYQSLPGWNWRQYDKNAQIWRILMIVCWEYNFVMGQYIVNVLCRLWCEYCQFYFPWHILLSWTHIMTSPGIWLVHFPQQCPLITSCEAWSVVPWSDLSPIIVILIFHLKLNLWNIKNFKYLFSREVITFSFQGLNFCYHFVDISKQKELTKVFIFLFKLLKKK